MQLRFRRINPDEVEKELTQRDQFNSDEVELIEALVREAHQNSLDAQLPGSANPVRTRIGFHTPTPDQVRFLAPLLHPLSGHLQAAGVDVSKVDFSTPKFLVIEDFGTTGLIGAWDRKDNRPFSDFWRRVGKSHKGGTAGGRWGLGKLVFSSASQARAFFGLTVRHDDPSGDALVMGQAVLAIHRDPETGEDLDAVGFFCELAENRLQLPVRERGFVEKFAAAVGITRQSESGLSIAIPYMREDLVREGLIRSLLRNYYFPILIGVLESTVDGVAVDAASFDSLAATYGGDRLSDGRVVAFVRELRARLAQSAPDFTLPTPLKGPDLAIPDSVEEKLRSSFIGGSLVHVRAPVALGHRVEGSLVSYVDLFLRLTDGDGTALIVRGGITLPLEGTEFRSRRCLAALIANDEVIAEFLGDAENPAHTKWNGNAEKLTANWVNGAARLREVRGSLNGLYNTIAQAIETTDRDAFLDVFSVPAHAGDSRPPSDPVSDPPKIPRLEPSRRLFNLRSRKDGFTVTSSSSISADDLPLTIRLEAAYDLLGGDPFARHSDVDFDFRSGDLKLESEGATVRAEKANRLELSCASTEFALSVSGFDSNRDLVVRARRVE
jgi:hypothetical protein